MSLIFVFGSNLAGIHGAGAAKEAYQKWGAKWKKGVGRHGMSYAIPTKDEKLNPLKPYEIKPFIQDFILYVEDHPEDWFLITAVGTGLANIPKEVMGELFEDVLLFDNCFLPTQFIQSVKHPEY